MKKNKDKRLLADEMEQTVLDRYFSTRSDDYIENLTTVKELKTTEQIQDDLRPILRIEDRVIVDYMIKNDFKLVQHLDGSAVWELWRMQ